ncbi:unnamed protein product [Polarella glacialis]|uniref:Uncharacterized protein n=1 Tax=Polarella glacialis TaxID=89957 RepID=A0A813GIK2_POLGL|nr:unnamed protein product [Polarella glacialis]
MTAPQAETLVSSLGFGLGDPSRLLATFTAVEFHDLVNTLMVPSPVDPQQLVHAPPGLVAKARLVGRLARCKNQVEFTDWQQQEFFEKTKQRETEIAQVHAAQFKAQIEANESATALYVAQAEAAKASAPRTSSGSGISTPAAKKVKLTHVLSQTNDCEVDLFGNRELLKFFENFRTVMGDDPQTEREPTHEQITAIGTLISEGTNPYADFAIWGPHGVRSMKKLKMGAMQLQGDGTWVKTEVAGPPTLDIWDKCFQVWATVLIMLLACTPARLENYRQHIVDYSRRYPPGCWYIVYQADNRCRGEHFSRLYRKVMVDIAKAEAKSEPPGFDKRAPWNEVLARAIDDSGFWSRELEQPALLVAANVTSLNDELGEDTAMGRHGSSAMARNGAQPKSDLRLPKPPRLGPKQQTRTHNVHDGAYVTNRSGYKLCEGFNSNQCPAHVNGWCTINRNEMHQCSKCLSQSHNASECGRTPAPSKGVQKGQGKGGRGKGKKNYQY